MSPVIKTNTFSRKASFINMLFFAIIYQYFSSSPGLLNETFPLYYVPVSFSVIYLFRTSGFHWISGYLADFLWKVKLINWSQLKKMKQLWKLCDICYSFWSKVLFNHPLLAANFFLLNRERLRKQKNAISWLLWLIHLNLDYNHV